MIHPCDKSCVNKTASGYCATTACINPLYSNIGTAQYGQGVQKRITTNADRIRSMTDEELAEYLYSRGNDSEYCYGICAFQDECKEWKSREFCIEHIVEWLRQEAKDD